MSDIGFVQPNKGDQKNQLGAEILRIHTLISES